jgi:hypothetical protein
MGNSSESIASPHPAAAVAVAAAVGETIPVARRAHFCLRLLTCCGLLRVVATRCTGASELSRAASSGIRCDDMFFQRDACDPGESPPICGSTGARRCSTTSSADIKRRHQAPVLDKDDRARCRNLGVSGDPRMPERGRAGVLRGLPPRQHRLENHRRHSRCRAARCRRMGCGAVPGNVGRTRRLALGMPGRGART